MFLAVLQSLAASEVKVQSVITIQDDDTIVIGFLNSEMNSISEKEGNISVIFGVVSGTLGLALTVEVITTDEGTKGDFIGVTVNTTLTPSSPNASVGILILQDNVVEDTESFSVNLMLVTQGLGQAVSIEPVKTSVLIIDQDVVTVGFKPDYLEVIETVELVTLTAVLLAGALERDLIVIVTTNFSSIVKEKTLEMKM